MTELELQALSGWHNSLARLGFFRLSLSQLPALNGAMHITRYFQQDNDPKHTSRKATE